MLTGRRRSQFPAPAGQQNAPGAGGFSVQGQRGSPAASISLIKRQGGSISRGSSRLGRSTAQAFKQIRLQLASAINKAEGPIKRTAAPDPAVLLVVEFIQLVLGDLRLMTIDRRQG